MTPSVFFQGRKLFLTIAWKMGLYLPLDRRVLQNEILPRYQGDPDIRRILFVGVRRYCAHYAALFPNQTYVTLDPDPAMSRFGSKWHVQDKLENLDAYFAAGGFDLMIVNGVFGWHISRPEDLEKALGSCHRCLRAGGELILGMNDDMRPIDLAAVDALRHFESLPDQTRVLPSPFCITHTYYFYRKP